MKNRNSSWNNQRGQFLVESLLLMVFSIGLLTAAVSYLRDKKVVSALVAGPWSKTAGMVESGSWAPSSQARNTHPNAGGRGRVLDPNTK